MGIKRLTSSPLTHNHHHAAIGDQMTKLFKDDHLYDSSLLKDPNYKLQSLRDLHCYNGMGVEAHVNNQQADMGEEHLGHFSDSNQVSTKGVAKTRYLSDESLYD